MLDEYEQATRAQRVAKMAVAGLSWTIPSTIGPGAAGYILDHYDPNLLLYIGGALCGLSAFAYYFLHLRLGTRKEFGSARDEALPFPATTD